MIYFEHELGDFFDEPTYLSLREKIALEKEQIRCLINILKVKLEKELNQENKLTINENILELQEDLRLIDLESIEIEKEFKLISN